jgi:alpha-L-rhamnosidase
MVSMEETAGFLKAQPVWPTDREREINLLIGFRALIDLPQMTGLVLRVTAATLYNAYVNGVFAGSGPARAPRDFARIDAWDLKPYLRSGKNVVAIEVAGYCANAFSGMEQPSYLQAEVLNDRQVLAYTGAAAGGFTATPIEEKIQKIQRYSFQRFFAEAYVLAPGHDRWRVDPEQPFSGVACVVQPQPVLLPRRVPYPVFALRQPVSIAAAGKFRKGDLPENPWKDRSLVDITPHYRGYPETQLDSIPSLEMQKIFTTELTACGKGYDPQETVSLSAGMFRIFDLGQELTGFIGCTMTCPQNARVLMAFDEILTQGDVDFKRMNCVNVVTYQLAPGTYHVQTLEAYALRYLKIMVLEGACAINGPFLREYANPDVYRAHFAASDPDLNRIFEAARETFRQNAVDIFMDCPSRERAGWLCDSFFTGRAAFVLSGTTVVEKNFLENFLLPDTFAKLPAGMLPMCFPADHVQGTFIPNWALWFIVELEEYLARSNDRSLVDALEPRVMALLDYFKAFLNSDGLLEKLAGWVFVEWSQANSLVQDVNYPGNMLYAGALDAAARLYRRPAWSQAAEQVRQAVRRQSFNGTFFVDNAVRREGKLESSGMTTEVCQYYAFYFDVATPQTHPDLWQTLLTDFGPQRKQTGKYPEVYVANAFIGNFLRIDLLSRYHESARVLEEIVGYFLNMARLTGTLWEHDQPTASCNHGFAAHVAQTLFRDALGIQKVDPIARRIIIRVPALPLAWCEGRIPLGNGFITMRWWKENSQVLCEYSVPAGYTVERA